jgi:hypothetical protein
MGEIEVTLPGRPEKRRGTSNKHGLLPLDGIVSGKCEMSLADMELSGWEQQ